MQITAEEMAVYKETAQRIWARERQELTHRCRRAWMLARQAAALLRTGKAQQCQDVLHNRITHEHLCYLNA